MYQIVLFNKHKLCLDALCQFIQLSCDDYNVVGLSEVENLFEILNKKKIDLIIVDFDASFFCNDFDRRDEKVIAIIENNVFDEKLRNFKNIKAILKKDCNGMKLKECIEIVLKNGKNLEDYHTDNSKLPSSHRKIIIDTLTKREKEILNYLTQGDSNKIISKALYIELSTVKLHVRNICIKLNVTNRVKAALFLKESTWN